MTAFLVGKIVKGKKTLSFVEEGKVVTKVETSEIADEKIVEEPKHSDSRLEALDVPDFMKVYSSNLRKERQKREDAKLVPFPKSI